MADDQNQEDQGTPAGGNTRNVPFPGMGTPIPSAPVAEMPAVETSHRNFDAGGQATAIAPPPQGQPPTQASPPVAPQEPPSTPDRELWEGLNKTRLYTDSYDDFKKQFNNPKSIDELYQGLSDSKLYTNSKEDFYSQFFQHLPPKEVTDAHSFLGNVLNTPAASKAIDKLTADQFYKSIYQQQQTGASGRDATKVQQPLPVRLTADAEADRNDFHAQAAQNPEMLRPVLSEIKRQNVKKSMFGFEKPADFGLNQSINKAAYIADANTREHSDAVVKHYADQLGSGALEYDIQNKQLVRPENSIASVFRGMKEHSDSMNDYDYVTSHSDEDVIKYLDEKNKALDPDKPVYRSTSTMGSIGNMVGANMSAGVKLGAGNIATRLAGASAPELTIPIAAITTMGMGTGIQDFHHVSYANTLAQIYGEIRRQHPDADPHIALEEAKKQANISGAVAMGQGLIMGEAGSKLTKDAEFIPVRYGTNLAKFTKPLSDLIKNNASILKSIAPDVTAQSLIAGGAKGIENMFQGKPVTEGVGDAMSSTALMMVGLSALHAPDVFLGKAARNNIVDGFAKAPPQVVDNLLGTLVAQEKMTPEVAEVTKQEIVAHKKASESVPDFSTPISDEAAQLLAHLKDTGADPSTINKKLLIKIASDHDIEPEKTAEGKDKAMSAAEIIDRLQKKQESVKLPKTLEQPEETQARLTSGLKGTYKEMNEKDPEGFLKFVAEQAHGDQTNRTELEQAPGVTKSLIDYAIQKYPEHIIAEPKAEPEATAEKVHHTMSTPEVVNMRARTSESRSDADIEKRMLEIEKSPKDAKEFDDLEKEMQSRERKSVFDVPLDKVNESVDALMKKEKEQPNGWGSFIEKRDAAETKEVADKYLKPKDISDAELKKDFNDAVMGNPDTWYADGLKLRESMKEAASRGIETSELVAEVEKHFIKDHYTKEEARAVVARKLKPIFENTKTQNDAISIGSAEAAHVAETSGNSTEMGGGKPGSEETAIPQENKNESQTVTEPEPAKNDVGEERTVGVRHESLRKIADRLGLEQPVKGTILSAQEQTERGRALLKAGADPNKVQEDFDNTGKVDADSISVARAHYENLVKDVQAAFDEKGKGSPEYIEAKKKADDWQKEVMKPMGTASGGAFTALQGETDVDTGSFISMSRAFEDRYGKEPNAEQEAKLKEASHKVKELTSKVSDLEQKLTEAIDKNVGSPKEKAVYTNKAKAVADAFRKLKNKPFTFKDENGNEINVTKMGVDWNDIVEAGAKIIEKTGEIADGIAAAIEKIKDADWYKGLSDSDKDRFAKQLEEHYQADAPELAYTDLAERLAGKKDNKFTPEDAKEIWGYMKDEYLRKGKDFDTSVNGTSVDLGISPEQVRKAITSPKSAKVISDQMYLEQYREQQAIRDAKGILKTANLSKIERTKVFKYLKATPNLFFALKTFGHGTVGNVTHSGMNIFTPSAWKTYWPNFAKQFKYAFGGTTKAGLAAYQQEMNDLIHHPQFAFWKRNGLAVDPAKSYDDYQQFNKHLKALTEMGDRGFNALKVQRLQLAEHLYNGLSEAAKADPNTGKEIAKIVNHSTGTADVPVPKAIGTLVFAPRLEASRWARLGEIAIKAPKTLYNWSEATEADKAATKIIIRRNAEIMGTYLAGLAANSAVLAIAGSKQQINYTDPTQSDWLKFKGKDQTLDMTGGMLSSLRFLSSLIHASVGERKKVRGQEEARSETIFKGTGKYIRGKLSPFGATALDVAGQADYSGRPLPFSSDKGDKFHPKYTWQEYLEEQQLPIPVSEAFKVTHDQMRDRGVPEATADQVLHGVISGAISGSTGARVAIDYANDKKEAKAEKDKKSAKPSLPPTQYH